MEAPVTSQERLSVRFVVASKVVKTSLNVPQLLDQLVVLFSRQRGGLCRSQALYFSEQEIQFSSICPGEWSDDEACLASTPGSGCQTFLA